MRIDREYSVDTEIEKMQSESVMKRVIWRGRETKRRLQRQWKI